MKFKYFQLITGLVLLTFLTLACQVESKQGIVKANEALPSWTNDSSVKSDILNFVSKVSDSNSPDFVPIKDRIAVFDNDGTLWNEKPLYIPVEYEISYIKEAVKNNPSMLENKLYKGLAEGDLAIMKEYSTFELIHQLFAAHENQLEDEYKKSVYKFLTHSNHPKFNRPFKEMVYQPMIELVHYLQDNDFKVYIVTGGEITFVRTVSEEIYNIPVENVIGSSVVLKYNNESKLVRTEMVQSANDKHIKPTNIELHIGKKPIFAAGNSDGDYEMMEYTLSGDGPSMAILVNHDDDEREYNYMHGTEKAVNDAPEKGWHVASMKNDFNKIFPN
ncbi:HAD family hydrolase [Carboxylicivirga sp. N1Y90]|uniref:HAD family hydrolase n=1 Tax=Carboxylicivirga fragile TaxID=3417571 RepID=UPI003D33B810|nr:haloacid dehalogenase-like hydrolase [Marinilabiliaceae bacterium N1Y90]